MALLAAAAVHAGGILAWVTVGLLAGWLAGGAAGERRHRRAFDLALGLLGALAGGFLFDPPARSNSGVGGGLWGSLAAAFLGAFALLALAHFLHRARRW